MMEIRERGDTGNEKERGEEKKKRGRRLNMTERNQEVDRR